MYITEVIEAVQKARRDISNADSLVAEMAVLCVGRLRRSAASPNTLEQLKRELRDYNIHTGKWKDES